jgi:hypothetical protein
MARRNALDALSTTAFLLVRDDDDRRERIEEFLHEARALHEQRDARLEEMYHAQTDPTRRTPTIRLLLAFDRLYRLPAKDTHLPLIKSLEGDLGTRYATLAVHLAERVAAEKEM